jgi:hypothetical protein
MSRFSFDDVAGEAHRVEQLAILARGSDEADRGRRTRPLRLDSIGSIRWT